MFSSIEQVLNNSYFRKEIFETSHGSGKGEDVFVFYAYIVFVETKHFTCYFEALWILVMMTHLYIVK